MPFSDPKKRKTYHRQYMRRRRAGVKPVVKPEQEPKGDLPSEPIDWNRPYGVEQRYPYPAYLIQDGMWYDPESGELLGPAR